MSRRSSPRKKIDAEAWPVVVRILIPEAGFIAAYPPGDDVWTWLNATFGRTEFVQTSHQSILGDAMAFHFRCLEDAIAFRNRFPALVLADDTMSETYHSPDVPFGRGEVTDVCNLYNITRAQDAMRQLFLPMTFHDRAGNLPEEPSIYPDYLAPIIRNASDGLELVKARWGLPTPPQFLVGKKTDRGVTNVRNTKSPHWRRWLGPEHRCLVPLTSFAEPDQKRGGNVWFSLPEDQLAFFAGIHVPNWSSVRKVKYGPTTDNLFGFLTTTPNAEVAAVHPKAMPVILTEPKEWQAWLEAPWVEAVALQRPLADGVLTILEISTLGK